MMTCAAGIIDEDWLHLNAGRTRTSRHGSADTGRRLHLVGDDTAERIGEGRFERVVGERVKEWVDGTVGVTEDGKELEQVHLVGRQGSRNADHQISLHNVNNIKHLFRFAARSWIDTTINLLMR